MKRAIALIAVLGLAGGIASAASIASDNASNYAATPAAWGLIASNLGSGFGAWNNVATNNNQPPYAGTYLDSSSVHISTSGDSWATYANSATAVTPSVTLGRSFLAAAGGYVDPSGKGTLFNQTFSIAMQSDGIGGSGQSVSFSLDDASGNPALTLGYFGGGNDAMTLTDDHGTNNQGVAINFNELNQGIIITVQVGATPNLNNPYTLTINPAPNNNTFITPKVFTGFTSTPMQQVVMSDVNTTNNEYFNSLSISAETPISSAVPTPAAASGALLCLAMLAGARKRRLI